MCRYGRVEVSITIVQSTLKTVAVGIAAAAPVKVDVCHNTSGTNEYVLINVSENAWEAHEAHGDEAPGNFVPGTGDLQKFDDDCGVLTLLDTVDVPSTTDAGISFDFDSESGVTYTLEASGTYDYGPGLADAQCSDRTNVNDGFTGWVTGDLWSQPNGLEVIWGSSSPTWGVIDWSPVTCQVNHEYSATIVGDGAPIHLMIRDNIYTDNFGVITVEIWGWV
jgi:hypothetical protein